MNWKEILDTILKKANTNLRGNQTIIYRFSYYRSILDVSVILEVWQGEYYAFKHQHVFRYIPNKLDENIKNAEDILIVEYLSVLNLLKSELRGMYERGEFVPHEKLPTRPNSLSTLSQ